MRKRGIIILLVFIFLGGIYSSYWFMYKKSMDDVNRDWYEKEYVSKSIKGVLKHITVYQKKPLKVVLSIKNQNEEFEIRYGATCVDEKFNSFVSEGDSVFKSSGGKEIRFCKPLGDCKSFELNFCGKFQD